MSINTLDPKTNLKVEKPKLFAVVFINDDFTPMEFVIEIMMKIFGHSEEKATAITMDIHKKGKGVALVTTLEIAETKAMVAMDMAKRYAFPLLASVEPEGS